MTRKNRIRMPQSTAGLIQYFEESKEAVKLKPEHVIAICVFLIIFELLVKFGIIRI